ncbi:MAG: cell Wall and Capsule [Hyphomicrobiales bacterium]|nr:cell Wall and Capsule [Hyphomicrobiales bacterium]
MLDRIALALAAAVVSQGFAWAQGAPIQLGKPAAPAAAAIQNAASPARVASPDAATAVRRANAFFNGITTLVGDFVQTSADGRRVNGKLYLQKPGRLRFEYAQPSPLEIVADGTSVAIRNRKLNTQDVYFISQTPLKFLLKQNLDLARDTKILDVSSQPNATSIKIEDKATLGGTSRITLTFRNDDFTLTRWSVNDPQGNDTHVVLANIDTNQKPDGSMFRINYERQDSN